ncbi:beta-L-arabinofuranosidase domain-containing protein [Cohnella yongneupensis]|uniref:Beta-L-arabinofuranosidase domain-containing protein n=1 Tax=Cohnella yongneupensis TaxID=425006 RepID=A0ABW0QZD8_9BACL
MTEVTLLDGVFKQSQNTGKGFLLQLDVDRLVAPCYEAASIQPKAPRYGGWESMQIAGHSIGHWLSAVAAMYAETKDEALLQKLTYAVDEISFVQSHDADGYVSGVPRGCFDNVFSGDFEVNHFGLGGIWVPWYSIHKIYAGLIDAYQLADIEKALQAVVKLADWAKRGTDRLTDEQFQRMLICEHGGMNEAMASLYQVTGNRDYLDLAIRFCHQAILEPLSRGIDELDGKHANTQIPKVIGAAKLYEITGEEKYRNIAEFFWNEVTKNRSYIFGGNSNSEHFKARNTEQLGVETAETCNTYNMLKLTEYLYRCSPSAAYMDFYERALYNHILASQDPDTGMKTYFISTEPGHLKAYCSAHDSFWCCTGTGMENPARYTRQIYHATEDAIYVNLFIASRAEFGQHGAIIRQETAFPRTDTTRLVVESGQNALFKLRIRVPYWISGAVTAVVNGSEAYTCSDHGYLEIERSWSVDDEVEIRLPMNLHLYRAKDNVQKVGFTYGPVVLAGALGREKFPESDIVGDQLKLHGHPTIDVPILVTDNPNLTQWIKPVEESPLTFVIDAVGQPGNASVTLIPFYELHHQRYTLYWKMMNEHDYRNYADHEKAKRDRLRAITVDVVKPHEQQSEVEHGLRTQASSSGYNVFAQGSYRQSIGDGYFSYRMSVIPDREVLLQVAYFGNDGVHYSDGHRYERDFDIVIDGHAIARQKLETGKPDQLFDVSYEIPTELTNGKQHVEVKFASSAVTMAGGVYGVRMVDRLVMEQWKV